MDIQCLPVLEICPHKVLYSLIIAEFGEKEVGPMLIIYCIVCEARGGTATFIRIIHSLGR